MNIPAQISRTRAEWAADIRAAHTEVVEAFLELGQKLLAAKQELAHGEFLQMIENDLPFTSSTAQRLMKIASNREQANAARAQLLPAKWTVAYELTKLPEGTLKTAVATGTIHPEMSREDAAALRPAVPEHAKTSGIFPVRETTALEVMSGILGSPRHWMRTFQRNMESATSVLPHDGWSRKQRDVACELVHELADRLVARISVIKDDSDDAAAVPEGQMLQPPDLTTPAGVRAAKQKRAEKASTRRARRL